MREAGAPSRLMVIPGAGHGNELFRREDVREAAGAFFAERLQQTR
jgi:hypothetical protein